MQSERRPWSRQLAILWAGQFTGISGVTIVYPFIPLLVETTGVHDPVAIGLWTAFGVEENFVRPDRTRVRPRALAVIRAEGLGSSVFTLMVLATLAQCITIGLTPVTPLRSAHLADSHHVAVSVGAVAAVQAAFPALAALTVA